MNISRRKLIKTTLAASAAAAAGISIGCKKNQKENTPRATESTENQVEGLAVVDKWVKGVCRMCGTGCSIYVGVKDGKMIAIKGNIDSKTNVKGSLCI